MTKGDRINLTFPDVINELDATYVEEQLRKRRHAYKSSQYIKKEQLLANDRWLKKLKSQVERFL